MISEEEAKKLWAMPLADVVQTLMKYNQLSGTDKTGMTLNLKTFTIEVSIIRKISHRLN